MLTPDAGHHQMKFSAIRAAFVFALFALAACDNPNAPRAAEESALGAATLSTTTTGKKVTCPGKSGGVCDMSVSVLIGVGGSATLTVRTGGYDEATGAHDPNGTFEKIQWKVYDLRGKLVSTKNSDASGTVFRTPLGSPIAAGYRVEVQANIRNHGGKKGVAVVRGVGTAAKAPDLSVGPIQLLVGEVAEPLAPVSAGVPSTFVASFTNTGTTGIAARCVVIVGPLLHPSNVINGEDDLYVAPGESENCEFTLTLSEGTHPVKVIAVIAHGYSDSNPLNNFSHATVTATASQPADLAVTRLERVVVGGNPGAPALGEVLAGETHTFKAWITSPASTGSTSATCSVTVNGAAPGTIQWTAQTVNVAAGATAECIFALSFPTAGTYQIGVVATSEGDPNAANNSAEGTLLVKAAPVPDPEIDLVVKSLRRDSGAGIVTIDTVPAGIPSNYVALIGAVSGSGQATCSATATNVTTNATQTVVGTVTGTASNSTDATCTFPLTLAGNGDLDQDYSIVVTAQPVGVAENPATLANNTLVAVQRAIVRVDVGIAIAGIEMFVNGVERAIKDTISLGKTATFVAHFQNFSSRDATVKCEVWTNPPGEMQVPVTVTGNPIITIPAGAVVQCPFDYTFGEAVVAEFNVKATALQPLDSDPSNNSGGFSITPVSNLAFPDLLLSNVDAFEQGNQNSAGVPTIITKQRVGITRVALAFTNKTAIIGDFVFTAKVNTNGQQMSTGVFTATGLTPGGLGAPNCVAGVDPGSAVTLNGHDVRMEICAEEAAGQPAVQVISVTYSSGLPTTISSPDGLFGIGSVVSFDLQLQWRLFGRTAPGWDQATGLLEFDVRKQVTDPEFGGYTKIQTGVVRIIRNGP